MKFVENSVIHLADTRVMNDPNLFSKTSLQKQSSPVFSLDSFFLLVQPQITLYQGHIKGFEGFVRAKTSQGLFSGNQCMEWGREHNALHQVNTWVMETGIQMMRDLPTDCMLSLNICTQDLDLSFATFILKTLQRLNIAPHRLCLEITEHKPPRSFTELKEIIRFLRKSGVKIAIDDFGTGHATLNYLVAFELDFVKIDKSYIRHIAHDRNKQIVLNCMMDLIDITDATLIMEGVETEKDHDMLIKLCEKRKTPSPLVQGYLYGRPGPLAQFSGMLHASQVIDFPKNLPAIA